MNFDIQYKQWDEEPNREVTRENMMSFLVWSFWDSRGSEQTQYARLCQLGKIGEISTMLVLGLGNIFTSEELQFAADVFNSLSSQATDRHRAIHTDPMSSADAATRMQKMLSIVTKFTTSTISLETKAFVERDLRKLDALKGVPIWERE